MYLCGGTCCLVMCCSCNSLASPSEHPSVARSKEPPVNEIRHDKFARDCILIILRVLIKNSVADPFSDLPHHFRQPDPDLHQR